MTKEIDILVVEPGKAPYPAKAENTLEAFQNIVGGPIEAELNDRAFIRRMSIVSPEEIIHLGRIETDVGLRFARIIRDKYNGGGAELPYRFKR